MKQVMDMRINMMTEEQMKTSLGRFLLVGVWSFFWKKKKKKHIPVIEFDYVDEFGQDGKLTFMHDKPSKFVEKACPIVKSKM